MGSGRSYFGVVVPFILQYLTQCWNQSGDTTYPVVDLVHDFLFKHPIFLWIPALVSYIMTTNSIARYLGTGTIASRIASLGLCGTAAAFKLCVAQRDNPELLAFAPPWLKLAMLEVDQTSLLRLIWTCTFGFVVYLCAQLRFSAQTNRRGKTCPDEPRLRLLT